MSFRPTIAIYAQNEIADIRFYPEWQLRDLVIEAVTLGALLTLQHPETAAECRTAIDRMRKLIPLSELRERKTLSETELQKELQDMEAMSDCSVIVDMTAGCVCRTDISSADRIYSDEDIHITGSPDLFSLSAAAVRIPFKEHAREILQAVTLHHELRSALSAQTADMLESIFPDLSGCSR